MFRLTLSAFVASLVLLNASAAYLRPAQRQIGDTDDVIGLFNVVTSVSFESCPNSIRHSRAEIPVPHSTMRMNGNACTGDGSMQILADPGVASAAVNASAAKERVRQLAEDVDPDSFETLIFGIEENGRNCGSRTMDQFEAGTLVIIVRTNTFVRKGALILRTDFRYMMVISPDNSECLYQTSLRPTAPSASPSAVVTPSSSVEPSVQTPTAPTPSTPTAVTPVVPTNPDPSDDSEDGESASPSASAEAGSSDGDGTNGDGDGDDDGTNGDGDGDDDGTNGDGDGDDTTDDGDGDGDDDGTGTGTGTGTETDDTGSTDSDGDAAATGEPSNTEEAGDDDVCFPADATVELEDGSFKSMAQISIGDRVKVGRNVYSDVFMFTHKTANVQHQFVTLETEDGDIMSATPGHYIYINSKLITAAAAKVGDTMIRGNGDFSRIVKVERETKTGLFNPQTVQGNIIVNGLQASTFTQSVEMCAAQAMMMPLRMVYKALGLSLEVFNNGADTIASYMPKGGVVA